MQDLTLFPPRYLYDGPQAVAELTDGRPPVTWLTGLAIDEILARYSEAGERTTLTDALGSVLALAGEDQVPTAFYAYSPFGETQASGGEASDNSSQYTGREHDGTGLYYYRARYYDPVLKRFISEDPIGLAGGGNVFAYVGNDPVSENDPFGLGGPDCSGKPVVHIDDNLCVVVSGYPICVGLGFAGQSVDDVAGALRSGAMKPGDIPI